MKGLDREVLLSFWKVHILYHASKEPLHGQWIVQELRRHGYEISSGTLYPLLQRLERLGWLKREALESNRKNAVKRYQLTDSGKLALNEIREQIIELHREVVLELEDDNEPHHHHHH